jgi:NAD(P)-dependent dehydrogenase (short-subunit alcohol dehydrogenase family)
MAALEAFRLDGKVAIVTGATGVLCQSMSLALAAAGAKVVVLARNEDKIAALTKLIREQGGETLGISADVLEMPDMRDASKRILDKFGQMDILVNGAGGNRPDATAVPGQRSFFDLPQEAMRWVFDLNLMGTILPSQIFGAVLAKQQSGVIINISSMAAYTPLTRVMAYASAKAAINNFTQWLAVYMATEHSPNIRVNAIAPGFFLGEQNRYLLIDKDTGNLTPRGQSIIDHTPMHRFGTPDDLVGTLLWLASDASRFVTGIVVPVDGGFMAFGGV